ncbi:MAG: hypothetical protein KZQ65_12625, partial [Candidatus Thiodiazotropha sp. (ex Gloverina cf. vestifex)]|nr:hypothetical protein [Candidatus Thiodiazotropha sp. (ex Gloverina cf. vestifex)]
MTPAVAMAKKSGIFFKTHQYTHDPSHESYGEEAAEKLAVDPARVFKTQACRYLVKDFGTSESPKSTRQRDSRYAPT